MVATTIERDMMGSSPELKAGPQTYSQRLAEVKNAILRPAVVFEVNGSDVSEWQGVIDWDQHASMTDFTMIRYSYGNKGIDTQAERNVQNAVDRGKPYCGYHYMKPALSWQENALNFATQILRFGGNLYPVGDLEESGGLAKQSLEGWTFKFWQEVEQKVGKLMACYTSAGFLNTAMGLNGWLKHKPLIVASWTNGPTPLIPQMWSVPGMTYEAWQWKVLRPPTGYGVQSGGLDLDRWNLSRAAFNAKFNIVVQPPAPMLPTSVRVRATTLTIRNDRIVADSTYIGYTEAGKIWYPDGVELDALNRPWYWFGDQKKIWIAAWLTDPI